MTFMSFSLTPESFSIIYDVIRKNRIHFPVFRRKAPAPFCFSKSTATFRFKMQSRGGPEDKSKNVTVQTDCLGVKGDIPEGRPCRSALAVLFLPVFHALIPEDFSKQNSKGVSLLRAALKRHPCRIGLNRPSMAGSP